MRTTVPLLAVRCNLYFDHHITPFSSDIPSLGAYYILCMK